MCLMYVMSGLCLVSSPSNKSLLPINYNSYSTADDDNGDFTVILCYNNEFIFYKTRQSLAICVEVVY